MMHLTIDEWVALSLLAIVTLALAALHYGNPPDKRPPTPPIRRKRDRNRETDR